MDPNVDTGSFGAPAGGMSPELQEAMQRRQTQGGVSGQVTNGSPNAQPMPSVSGNPQMVQTNPQSNGIPQASSEPLKGSSPDSAIILGAMKERMHSENKIRESQSGIV